MCRTSLCSSLPPAPRIRTRPATDKSRSNQVPNSPPPYVSMFTMSKPDLVFLLIGFTFRQGLSVCAPTMYIPLPGAYFLPTAKATMLDMLRVKKYLESSTQLSVLDVHVMLGTV